MEDGQALQAVVTALLGVLTLVIAWGGKVLIAWLQKKADAAGLDIKIRMDNDNEQKLAQIVDMAVKETEQTYVSKMQQESGGKKLTREQQDEARGRASAVTNALAIARNIPVPHIQVVGSLIEGILSAKNARRQRREAAQGK
jgi:hypothetical protein